MKRKNNTRRLASVLSTFSVGEDVTFESADDGVYRHDEADITMISYVLEASNYVEDAIQVLSDSVMAQMYLFYWYIVFSIRTTMQGTDGEMGWNRPGHYCHLY